MVAGNRGQVVGEDYPGEEGRHTHRRRLRTSSITTYGIYDQCSRQVSNVAVIVGNTDVIGMKYIRYTSVGQALQPVKDSPTGSGTNRLLKKERQPWLMPCLTNTKC